MWAIFEKTGLRALQSAPEKLEQKQKCCICNFVPCVSKRFSMETTDSSLCIARTVVQRRACFLCQTASSLGGECTSQAKGRGRATHLLGIQAQELHLQNPGVGWVPKWQMVRSLSVFFLIQVGGWEECDILLIAFYIRNKKPSLKNRTKIMLLFFLLGVTPHLQLSVSWMITTCSTWRASHPKKTC